MGETLHSKAEINYFEWQNILIHRPLFLLCMETKITWNIMFHIHTDTNQLMINVKIISNISCGIVIHHTQMLLNTHVVCVGTLTLNCSNVCFSCKLCTFVLYQYSMFSVFFYINIVIASKHKLKFYISMKAYFLLNLSDRFFL